jgi:hypothetical protein
MRRGPVNVSRLDRKYRRYRAELRMQTQIDFEELIAWCKPRIEKLLVEFDRSDPDRSDPAAFAVWARMQYLRAHGLMS